MTPTAKVVSLLKQNSDKLVGIKPEHGHAFMIKPSDWSKKDCLIRVSELPAGKHEYGNTVPINEEKAIQIEFYYPVDCQQDMDLIEKSVKSFLFAHKIRCYSDAGHVVTPDNGNIENTLKFNYIEEDI